MPKALEAVKQYNRKKLEVLSLNEPASKAEWSRTFENDVAYSQNLQCLRIRLKCG